MDHIKILKRAFRITLNYRALWIFGILLAFFAARGGGNGGGGGNVVSSSNRGQFWSGEFPHTHLPEIPLQWLNAFIAAGILFLCVILFLIVMGTILRYVSETALIRMVDHYERTDEKLSVREGFRLGWSRGALRIFLIDLLVFLVVFSAFFILMLVSATPLLAWLFGNTGLGILGTIVSVGLFMLLIFFTILVAIVISVVMNFIHRVCVLENLGVFEAFQRGAKVALMRLSDVVIMALILFGLTLAWVILTIPIAILLVMAGAVLGGLPALLAGMIASLFASGALPWIIAFIFGAPIFLVIFALPLFFLGGLFEVFKSSSWTLTYREILALQPPVNEELIPSGNEDEEPVSN